jgi:hypothetical protein
MEGTGILLLDAPPKSVPQDRKLWQQQDGSSRYVVVTANVFGRVVKRVLSDVGNHSCVRVVLLAYLQGTATSHAQPAMQAM